MRAFVGAPQPVEVHHCGVWYSGALLGWRHTSDGRVSARVRCTIDGLRQSTWKDLSELRLPDPAHPPRSEPFPAALDQPVPGMPMDDSDRTRPDNVFAELSTRPSRPAHAGTPPARPGAPLPPAAAPTAAPPPQDRPRPTPRRRSESQQQPDAWFPDRADARTRDHRDERLSTV
jgi:hypothetical protein